MFKTGFQNDFSAAAAARGPPVLERETVFSIGQGSTAGKKFPIDLLSILYLLLFL